MPYVLVDPVAVSEGAASASFVIRLDVAAQNTVTVSYSFGNGTATNGSDYNYHYGTLTFAPGETTKTLSVPIVNNTVFEPTELFWLDLSSAVNAVIKQRYTPALIFDDDGSAGTPGLSVNDVVVDESARTATFFVSLNRPSTGVISLGYSTADGTAVAGQDYAAAVGTLTFTPGEMVKTVTVDLINDALAETDERFMLQLSNPTGASLVDPVGVAMIGRNDGPPVGSPQITVKPIAVGEDDTFANFVVQLSAPSLNEVRVNYSQDNGTAANGSDYSYYYGTLVFAPGETTKTLPVVVLDNTTAESTEVFWLDLSAPVNAVIAQRYTPALIFDNDGNTGTPAISVGDVVVDEASQSASFFVSLNRPSVSTVTVGYATADDTTVVGLDYSAAAGTLSFAPGEMVKTVTVDLINDALAETDERFVLQLSSPTGASLADPVGVATIGRNDGPPVGSPQITVKPIAVGEGDTFANFVVQLSAPSLNEVRVNYSQDNGTAANGSDYSYYYGTLVFAPGETTKTLPVVVLDNTTAESTEVFWLDLSAPVNAVIAQRYTPALIFDDDGNTGTPAISVGDVVVDEASQSASFFVSLNRPSVSTVTVGYSTADDTAAASQDYTAVAGTLSFAPGEVVKSVTVDLIDDSLAEPDERFQLLLANPVGATLGDAVGAALIGRSDLAPVSRPQVLTTPVAVSEGETFANFIVQLSAPSHNEVRVNFAQNNDTAANGSDYSYYYGTLVFAPGETTKTLPVVVLDDTAVESPETFRLDLTGPVNATVAQRYTTATIHDNDGSTAIFSFGLGNDLYTVTGVLDRVIENPNGGIDTVRSSVSYVLPDNVENLVLTGSALNATGNAGNNVFRGTAAGNLFDGQGGIDTVIFSGPRASYSLAGNVVSRTVSGGPDGNDTLLSIERLQFTDTLLASDTNPGGNTYNAFAMFNAAFNRAPAQAELSMWTAQLDRLGNTQDLAQAMINHYAPGVPNDVLVTHLWGTIVGTAITLNDLATYVGLIDNGTYTQASLLELVSVHPLNTVELVGVAGQTLTLDPAYFPPPG